MGQDQAVGRIEFECHRPPPVPVCLRCLLLERGIRKYLEGYASRRMHEEGKALDELRGLVNAPEL